MSLAAQAFEHVTGLDVFTTDEEEIGTVSAVLESDDDPARHFLIVRAAALTDLLGTERLYIPDHEVAQVEADRVILAVTADALNRPDWTTEPLGARGQGQTEG
jgi:ribosomal 30S subunit maturation factor RimM